MDRDSSAEERNRLHDLWITSWCLLGAVVAGALVIVGRFTFGSAIALYQHRDWIIQGHAFTCLLWALGWFAAAFVFGFLFGIPKILQTVPTAVGSEPKGSGSPKISSNWSARAFPLKVNTNLEEISDWLTKILVGATLTQLIKMPRLVRSAARYMASGMGGSTYETVAAATFLYFASIGFLSGYLLTRMFFSLAFARADHPIFPDVESLSKTSIALGAMIESDKNIQDTVEKLENVTISDSLTTPQVIAVAKAANIGGNTDRAIRAARLAIEKSPSSPEAHLNLAVALFNAGESQAEVMHELKLARRLVDRSRDSQTAEDIYISIMYLALYLDPPEGFQRAIQDGEDFVKSRVPTNAAIWISLASAYGQFYKYYKNLTKGPGEPPVATEVLEQARQRALDCVRKAIEVEPQSMSRLRELYDGTGPDPRDDDLEVFKGDKAFEDLLRPRV
jgi:tetratricopeptide (TPR) repeat protein